MSRKFTQTLGSVVASLAIGVPVAFCQTPPKRETTITKEVTKDGDTVSKSWQRSTEVVGKPITIKGENVGKVEDLVVDVHSGRVVYGIGTMTSAGTDRYYPIPWPAGHYSVETQTYDLPVETTHLQTAPTFTHSEPPNFADQEFATRTFKSYNQTPYWKTESTVVRTSDTPTTTYTQRWTQQPTHVHRVSDLRGRTIRTRDGATLGQINEVVLDPQSGRIVYAVTTRDGTSVPIPWSALHVHNNDFELSISADRWKSAPVIETERWSILSEPQWSQQVYRYYEVTPDWQAVDDDDDD